MGKGGRSERGRGAAARGGAAPGWLRTAATVLEAFNPVAPLGDDWLREGRYEIEVAGERLPAAIHLTAPWDPKGLRMRG